MTTEEIRKADRDTWLSVGERGTLLGFRVVFYMATFFGRWPARLLVRAIALYYALFDRPARRSSRQWWNVIHGTEPTFGTIYRHILRFAQVTLDRIFFLQGKTHVFAVESHGHELLDAAVRRGQGAVLLGAHLGSFEAMRASAHSTELKLSILGHFENAKLINALFQTLNPGAAARVIHIDPRSVDFIFKAQQRIEAGELVALLGDRTGLGEKSVVVDFFGRPARLPTGAFTLAAVFKCPLFLTFGLYREPNRYDLHCEVFEERVALPRRNRQELLRELVQRYAHRLEHYCRLAPDNWFNFFDVWEAEPDAPNPAPAGQTRPERKPSPQVDRLGPPG
jgi:predicted LPLAT superfamily acyltransferase